MKFLVWNLFTLPRLRRLARQADRLRPYGGCDGWLIEVWDEA